MPSESVLSDNPFDLLNDEEGEGGSDKKDSKAAPKQAERPKTDKRDKAKHGAEPQKNAATVQRGGKGGAATRGGRPVKHDGFDRKSGSGTSERSKRKGNGKYNWGRDVDVVGEDGFTTTNKPSRNPRKKSETVAEQPAAEKPAAEVKQETAPASTEPAAEEAVPEDTTPEFGLEEYRALQLKNRPEGDDKQAREVKIDEKKWKAPVKVLNKEEDAKETKAEAKSTQKRSTENKKLLSLQEFYAITPAAAPAPREQRNDRSAPSSSSGEFRGGRAEDAVEEEVDKNVPLALKAALLLSLVLPVVDLKEVDVEEEAEEEVDLLAADLIEDVEEVVDKEPLVVALAKEPPSPSMTSMLSPSWAASKFLLKRHFRMMGFLQSFDVVL